MTTAVLLCVPDAEPLVRADREAGDPSARVGVPAHVTLLYPFLPAERVDEGVLEELRWFFSGVDAFRLSFSSLGRFPDAGDGPVLYLAPDQADEIRNLTQALVRRWPECPPYEGRFDEVVPHLTVAQGATAQDEALAQRMESGLPLRTHVEQAALWMELEPGRWGERDAFRFAPTEPWHP